MIHSNVTKNFGTVLIVLCGSGTALTRLMTRNLENQNELNNL